MHFLLALLGRTQLILTAVTTLTTNWTSTRAAFLDAAISSRAAAATALLRTTWTDARAAALDSVAAVAANITTMLQRPTLSPITTLDTDNILSVAAYRCVFRSKGMTISGIISPGAGGFTAAINEVGRGIINFLALAIQTMPGSGTIGYRITIDGTVFTGTLTGGATGRANIAIGSVLFNDAAGAGSEQPAALEFENINFLTLFKVEFTNSVAGGQFFTYSRYRRTG